MKTVQGNAFLLKMTLMITALVAVGFSMTLHPPTPLITMHGSLNCPVISEKGGTAYLQITVTTPNLLTDSKRKPMNLSVVIDRSGSMSDQHKMEFAKKAFAVLIDQLQPEDILSLVVYDDIVDVVRKAKQVGVDKQIIKRMLDEITPRGSTNLGGGLTAGLLQAEKFAGREYINRVVLLSDGLANVGMIDPASLNSVARRYRNRSISITTMGVGLDYNENLMMGLSESGGGNYYFIEHPNALASIARQEFDMVSSVVAQNAFITLTLGENVHVNDIVGCEFRNEHGTYTIPVGDLYANESREFTVELSIPEGHGKKFAASGELQYESSVLAALFPKFSANVSYTKDFAEIEKNRDIHSQAKADIAVSTRKVEQAMQSMDIGDQAGAARQLNEAKEMISNAPAASAMGAGGEAVRSKLGKIESYEKTAREDSDNRRVKKSIQYDNYKTKKNKK